MQSNYSFPAFSAPPSQPLNYEQAALVASEQKSFYGLSSSPLYQPHPASSAAFAQTGPVYPVHTLPYDAHPPSCFYPSPTAAAPPPPAPPPPDPVIYTWMRDTKNSKGRARRKAQSLHQTPPDSFPDPITLDSLVAKRARHTYSNTQVVELEKEFHTTQYLSKRRREELSRDLHLSERQIKIWFQNRRMKNKRWGKRAEAEAASPGHTQSHLQAAPSLPDSPGASAPAHSPLASRRSGGESSAGLLGAESSVHDEDSSALAALQSFGRQPLT